MTVLEQRFMERMPIILRDLTHAIEEQNAVMGSARENPRFQSWDEREEDVV